MFSNLQVCTIYLVNYYIRKLAHVSVLLLSSKHKIVKSKFLVKKFPKLVKSVKNVTNVAGFYLVCYKGTLTWLV